MFQQAFQKVQILQETIAELLTNQVREFGVGLMKPSSWSDSISNVNKFIRAKDSDKVLENCGLDEIRVELSYTVDLVRPNNCKECHPDALGLAFLNDRHLREQFTVSRELLLNTLQEEQVDVVDYLHVAWKQVLHEGDRPLLKSFRKNGVVGVTERTGHN